MHLSDARKDAQDRIRVAHIDDEKHENHVGPDALVWEVDAYSVINLPSIERPTGESARRSPRLCYSALTVPLRTVRNPCDVRTCRNPRASKPSLTPSKPPFSS